MKNVYFLIFGFLLSYAAVQAQQTYFSQFYTSSVYLNPALAGIQEGSRLTLNYRNQWPQIQNSFITQNVSFETNLSQFNNGLGVNVYRDQAGDGMLTVSAVSGVYAHEFKLSKDLYLRVGMKSGFVQKNVAWDKLVFEDMIDSREGVVHTTQQEFGEAISYLDVSSGMFLYSDKYYGGISINHLNEAQAGLINETGETKLKRGFTFHGGAKFDSKDKKGYSISPNVILSKQGSFSKYNLGAYVEAKALVVGLWYSSDQAVVMIFGVKTDHFQIGYSYDLYPSTMTGTSLGSHEISYVHTFKQRNRKVKKYRTTSCPKF